jgi:membrane-bound metal-dependent hydrolase YbcI (DUF457 family)
MFGVGHMALGYLLAKGSAHTLKANINIPLVLVLSIIPDIDILAGEGFHRGPTHSFILAVLVFTPIFLLYRKQAMPYFLALVSHLIGDLFIGGNLQLFWPLSTSPVSLPIIPKISIFSPINVALELTLFIAATLVMYKAKDLQLFFQKRATNLILIIPVATVLLPTFLAYPLNVPVLLIPPHLFYLGLFLIAIFVVFFKSSRPTKERNPIVNTTRPIKYTNRKKPTTKETCKNKVITNKNPLIIKKL